MIICQTLRLVSLLKNDHSVCVPVSSASSGAPLSRAKSDHRSPMLMTRSSASMRYATVSASEWRSPGAVRAMRAASRSASTVADMAFQIEVGGSRNSRSSASSSHRSALMRSDSVGSTSTSSSGGISTP